MSDYTTVSGSTFPVEDITHYPYRTQSENLKSAFGDNPEITVNAEGSVVPKILTVERAIKYFEENAVGELEKLYTFTAQCLRAYNNRSTTVTESEDNNE